MSGIQSQKPSTKVRKKLLRIKKITHGLHNKYSLLDVAGVLNPLKCVPTQVDAQTILFKYLPKDNNWSF